MNEGNHQHPFHLHAHHMQIITHVPFKLNLDSSPYFALGEWRDTIHTMDGQIYVRFTPWDYPGETVLHCHNLRHEDLGMMTTVYFCDPTTTGGLPAYGCPQAAYPLNTIYQYPASSYPPFTPPAATGGAAVESITGEDQFSSSDSTDVSNWKTALIVVACVAGVLLILVIILLATRNSSRANTAKPATGPKTAYSPVASPPPAGVELSVGVAGGSGASQPQRGGGFAPSSSGASGGSALSPSPQPPASAPAPASTAGPATIHWGGDAEHS